MWNERLADFNSKEYKELSMKVMMELKTRVFKKMIRFADKMKFRKGSIVIEVSVVYHVHPNGSTPEDPEKRMRDAIKVELKHWEIYPDSLSVSHSYSGVILSEWKASAHDCIHGCHKHRKRLIKETRTCTEVSASCDGIPLTRKECCRKACDIHNARHRGWYKAHRILIITCVVVGVVILISIVIILRKTKKAQKKYITTSPSTDSIKKLALNDELEIKPKC